MLTDMYEGELTTRTSDPTTSKVMWDSVISTPGAWFLTGDTNNFYLATTLEKFQYLRILIELIPPGLIDLYHLLTRSKMVSYTVTSFVVCMDYQKQVF